MAVAAPAAVPAGICSNKKDQKERKCLQRPPQTIRRAFEALPFSPKQCMIKVRFTELQFQWKLAQDQTIFGQDQQYPAGSDEIRQDQTIPGQNRTIPGKTKGCPA